MCFFFSLIPATIFVVLGYFILFSPQAGANVGSLSFNGKDD